MCVSHVYVHGYVCHHLPLGTGSVPGGADTVIDALLDAVGPHGTLCLPTLSYLFTTPESPIFDVRSTPTNLGAIPEAFRRRPTAVRSVHPTHSVTGACEIGQIHLLVLFSDSALDLYHWESVPWHTCATRSNGPASHRHHGRPCLGPHTGGSTFTVSQGASVGGTARVCGLWHPLQHNDSCCGRGTAGTARVSFATDHR